MTITSILPAAYYVPNQSPSYVENWEPFDLGVLEKVQAAASATNTNIQPFVGFRVTGTVKDITAVQERLAQIYQSHQPN